MFRGFLLRFKRDKKGAAVVEFAFVALPFFLLLFAAIDIGLMFFASSTLENGIHTAARRIRTGEVASTGMTSAQFRTLVCNEISALLGCDQRLGLDVRVFDSFANVNFPAAVDQDGNLTGNFQFQPGNPGDVVLVRAFYVWPMLTPVVGEAFANMAGHNRLVQGAVAFRNEPFGSILP